MSPRMLITGGGGTLGGRTAVHAQRAGWQVVATIRNTPAPDGVEAVRIDLTDVAAVAALLETMQPDVVVHTAYDKRDNGPASVTRAGTVAIAEHHNGRLIHTSTDLVFSGRKGAPYAEADPPDPIDDYGTAKAWAEAQLADRPDTLITRLSLLIDLDDGGEQIALVRAAAAGDAMLFTDELRCPTLVADVAAALVMLAATDHVGLLHLGGTESLDRATLGRRLAATAGVSPDSLHVGPTPAGANRASDVRLDSSLAQSLGIEFRAIPE